MIGFLSDYATPAVAIDAITLIGREKPVEIRSGTVQMRTVHYQKGDGTAQFDFHAGTIDQLMKRPTQLMPAEAGAKLIYLGFDDGKPWMTETPMVAWALCLDGRIRPVTPAGVDDDVSEPPLGWWVKTIDGEFFAVDGAFDIGRADNGEALLSWASDQFRQMMPAPKVTE